MAMTRDGCRHRRRTHRRLVAGALLGGALVLVAATAVGDVACLSLPFQAVDADETTANDGVDGAADDGTRDEAATRASTTVSDSGNGRVTMTIDVNPGETLNLSVPDADVVVDTWKGDNVLVIMEKLKVPAPRVRARPHPPVDIRVSRRGDTVRIAAVGGAGELLKSCAVRFRVLVPENRAVRLRDTYDSLDVLRLAAHVWRTIGKEALRWVLSM